MGEKLVIGPINKGLRNDRTAFVIDNDSFPELLNAYQWRGRVKRKRGTSLLGRLTRFVSNASVGNMVAAGGGAQFSGNLISIFGLESTAAIVPGSMTITACGYPWSETVPPSGFLLNPDGQAGSTINYATGAILLLESVSFVNCNVAISFSYYPNLPVMGLREFVSDGFQYPGTLGFDTTYSYNISTSSPYNIYDVTFYKNPPNATFPGYSAKTTWTPFHWNGANYQQFYTTNYQSALWATNGIDVPFTGSTIGMQFAPANTITFSSRTATTLTLVITNCPLVIGDFVFVNEFGASTAANAATLNFQSGYVTAASPNTPGFSTKTITITFPNAAIAADTFTPGIVQYLTNSSNPSKDCIRWYDGDPTNGVPPLPSSALGWVNFMPPLSQNPYIISDEDQAIYYLVGARVIFPFKDRLLFFGAVIQTSTGNPIYLQDTVIYSQNGPPYYTASFSGSPVSATTVFNPILTADNETAAASAWFEDQTGFGGFQAAGVDMPIATVSPNEDALIVGFSRIQTRFLYTGNDITPFSFYIINSELGSGSTFSTINMDQGVLTRGARGFVITSQTSSQRFDLEIPDQVFEINLINNGAERMTSQRDFINEWVYFTYPTNLENPANTIFPNQTLQYNYRDDSWGVFNESYTAYGQFRPFTGITWNTLPSDLTWETWDSPWNSGTSTLLQPIVIGGNQQGFVIFRAQGIDGTSEGPSLEISAISGSQITSPNHCLNQNDYIIISGAVGANVNLINGLVFSVATIIDANNFILNPSIGGMVTYAGLGVITRMYVPFIQTKQFPTSWGLGRKTRLGPQQYLLSKTVNAQVTLLIFLSQDDQTAWNNSPIVPSEFSTNNSLIYTTVLYTCPESTNLGLTPANTNLQQLNQISSTGASSNTQQQIWHRMNTSLIGDTVQLGITLSDMQMRTLDANGVPISQFAEIELHGIILDVQPSSMLS